MPIVVVFLPMRATIAVKSAARCEQMTSKKFGGQIFSARAARRVLDAVSSPLLAAVQRRLQQKCALAACKTRLGKQRRPRVGAHVRVAVVCANCAPHFLIVSTFERALKSLASCPPSSAALTGRHCRRSSRCDASLLAASGDGGGRWRRWRRRPTTRALATQLATMIESLHAESAGGVENAAGESWPQFAPTCGV